MQHLSCNVTSIFKTSQRPQKLHQVNQLIHWCCTKSSPQ